MHNGPVRAGLAPPWHSRPLDEAGPVDDAPPAGPGWMALFLLRLADGLRALWPPMAVLAALEVLAHEGSLVALVAVLAALCWGLHRLVRSLAGAEAERAWTARRRFALGGGVAVSTLASLALLGGTPPVF